jgi:hypothetical protein
MFCKFKTTFSERYNTTVFIILLFLGDQKYWYHRSVFIFYLPKTTQKLYNFYCKITIKCRNPQKDLDMMFCVLYFLLAHYVFYPDCSRSRHRNT